LHTLKQNKKYNSPWSTEVILYRLEYFITVSHCMVNFGSASYAKSVGKRNAKNENLNSTRLDHRLTLSIFIAQSAREPPSNKIPSAKDISWRTHCIFRMYSRLHIRHRNSYGADKLYYVFRLGYKSKSVDISVDIAVDISRVRSSS